MRRLSHLAAIAGLGLMPLAATAQTADEDRDSGFLSRMIEDNLSTVSRTVEINGFRGALSSRATMTSITIADEEGVWLVAEGLVLDWNRAAVLRGDIRIRELGAERISILRPPIAEPQPPSPEATVFALPELPLSIDIEEMLIGELRLGPDFLDEEVILRIAGSAELDGGEGAAEITADRLDGAEGRFLIDASYSNTTRILGLNLVLSEEPGGIAARVLGLPGQPSVDLELVGTGPIDDYTATLVIATDGVTRITGEAGLVTLPDPEGGPPGQDFRLNVQGDVAALTDPSLEPFFGNNARLDVQGGRDGEGRLTLRALEVETASLDLQGQAVIAPDGWPERLQLQGRIAGEDGAPVTLPFGSGETQVRSLTLEMTFDADQGDAWSGRFDLSDMQRPGIEIPSLTIDGGGVIVAATPGMPGRFLADIDYAATGLRPDDPALAEALGSDISGELRITREDDGILRIARLTMEGPGITIAAEGTVLGAEDRFLTQSSILLEASDASRFGPLTGLDLGGSADVTIVSSIRPLDGMFDVIVTGGTNDLAFGIAPLDPLLAGEGQITLLAARDEAGLRVPALDIATRELSLTGSADVTSGESSAVFELSLRETGLALPGLSGPALLRGQAARDAAGLLSLATTASLPGTEALIEARTETAQGPVLALVTAAIADLSVFADLAGLPLAGAAEARVEGSVAQDGSLFDLAVTAATRDLAIGQPEVDLLLAGTGGLEARVLRSGPATFAVQGLDLATGALALSGDFTAQDGRLAGDLDGRLNDVAPFVEGLSGPVTLTGSAARDTDGTLTLDLGAGHAGAVARIDGQLTPPEQGLAFEGTVGASVPALQAFGALTAPLLGAPATGGLDLTATGRIEADLSLFDLTLAGTTSDLRLGIAQVDPLLAGEGTVSLRALRTGPEEGALEALQIATPGLTLAAEGRIAEGEGSAQVDLAVTDVAPLAPGLSGPARITGTAVLDDADRITLEARATAPGTSATLAATVASAAEARRTTLRLEAEAASLAPFSTLAGRPLSGSAGALVTGSFLPDASAFDLTLAGRATNPDAGIPALATLLRGSGTLDARLRREGGGGLSVDGLRLAFPNLTVTGDLSGRDSAGTARFDARLADVALFAPDFPGPLTATGTARLDAAGNWQVQTDATGPGGTSATVSGIVAGPGALNLTINGAAPLGFANQFIEPRRIEGRAGFNLRLVGEASLEALSGAVTLSDGRLTDPTLQQALTGLAGTITLTAGRAQLALESGLEAGGRLSLSGPVGLGAPFLADLSLIGRGLVLRDPSLYSTTADAAITVTGPLAGGARIAGTVDLGPVEIRIPSSPVGALGSLPEVRHVSAPPPVRETLARAGLTEAGREIEAEGGGGSGAFLLDLVIRAPSRVFIRGRGLDAELGGELAIRGTTAQPIPTGGLELIRGRLDILNQRFDLTEGSATLVGDFVPFLRLVARTTAQTGTIVDVTIEGPATGPEVTFRSQPELPEDEVLAQLIFGRDLSQISPLQAVQLASAVATLSGRGGGLVDGFREQLGVDDFDIAADSEGNAALRLGTYLTEQIYTDVTVGTTETQINLNLDLTEDITVKGSASTSGETSIGIYFERDY